MPLPTDPDATEVQPTQTRTDYIKPGMKAKEGEEIWAITVPGTVHLRILTPNRFGQMVDSEMSMGPGRAGQQFRLKTIDREENQVRCVEPGLDPFLNGMLVRIDADQQADPSTASKDALSTQDLLDIFDLPNDRFAVRIADLGEVVTRRMIEVGLSMDVSHRQIKMLEEGIQERFSVMGGPQASLYSVKGERLTS